MRTNAKPDFRFSFVGSIKTSEIVLTTVESNQRCCIGCSDFFVAASEVPFGDHLRCAHTLTAHHIHNQLLESDGNSEPFVSWILAQQQQGARVIKLSKSTRATPRYGIALLKDEAAQANCNRVGICTVIKDNHQITVRCWSTQCKHSHRLLVSQESGMCPHAKLVLAYIRESDIEVLADDEGAHDSEADTKLSKTAGVWFDSSQTRWWPDENCSHAQIPYEPNGEAKGWFRRRLTMDDIERSENGRPTKDERGCFKGDPCVALQCSGCEAKIAEVQDEVDVQALGSTIVIHTLSGPVARQKYVWVCTCGQRNHWDPSSEFIHTIRSGAEGGMSHFCLRTHNFPEYFACTCKCCLIFACGCILGGYELIYRFLGHVSGMEGLFSGISMHMGHFNDHLRHFSYSESYHASFSPDNWRTFLQSGVALWMSSIARLMPCCNLKVVGGDGTSVGIPIGNVAGLKPVWQPATLINLPETTLGHRHGREFITLTHNSFDGRYLVKLRNSLRLCLSASVSDREFTECVDLYFTATIQALPKWFTPAFELFLTSEGDFRVSLRIMLRNLISETSVSTLVPLVLLEPLRRATSQFGSSPSTANAELNSVASLFPYGHIGILPEIQLCMQHAERRSPNAFSIVAAVIIQLGENFSNVQNACLHAHAIYTCTCNICMCLQYFCNVFILFSTLRLIVFFSVTGFGHMG